MGNKADIEYSRELDLEEKFNLFWNKALKTNGEDYLSRLTNNDLVEMKKAISKINNLITLRVTLAFIDKLCRRGIINSKQADNIKKDVQRAHPNTNGFDVRYPNPNRKDEYDGLNLIAEVKCNIPVGETSFGAAQKNALKKDLQGLRWDKAQKAGIDPKDYYKFMVIQDVPNAREAMEEFIVGDCVKLDEKKIDEIDKKHIYIVYVKV